MFVKKFTEQEFIQGRHFADLGETGDFYADEIALSNSYSGVGVASGVLVKGGKEQKASLEILFSPEVDLSGSAGQIFQSGWDSWTLAKERN